MAYTDLELVEKFLAMKQKVAVRKEALEQELKPLSTAMEWVENEFLRRFQERGCTNSKTDAGTAYSVTLTDFKVVDRGVFLEYCIDNWDKGGSDMLRVAATKDAVKEYMNGSKTPPPGLEQSQFVRVNIRRT